MGHRRRRLFVVALTVVALALPAVALALTPRSGHYGQCRNSSGATVACTRLGAQPVVQFDYKSRRIYRFFAFNSCVLFPFRNQKSFPVRRDGSFRFHGFVNDILGERWEETISGKFTAATTVRGAMTFKKLEAASASPRLCTRTTKFIARRTGQPTPG